MKKKDKKKLLVFIPLAFLLVLFSVLIIIFKFDSQLVIQGLDPVDKNDVWGEIPINIKSPYLGELTNTAGRLFCDSNDGDVTLNNNYEINGDRLSLESSLTSGNYGRTCGGNFIYIEMQIPSSGVLTGDYLLSADGSGGGSPKSVSSITVSNSSGDLESIIAEGAYGYPASEKQGNFSIVLDSAKTITVKLETHKTSRGSASAQLELSFSKGNVNPPHPPKPDRLYLWIVLGALAAMSIVAFIIYLRKR